MCVVRGVRAGGPPPASVVEWGSEGAEAGGVFGSRWMAGWVGRREQPCGRQFVSRVFHAIVQAFFWMNIRDTQCGAKVMHREAVEAIHGQLTVPDMAFDINLRYALKTNKVNAALADSAALVDIAERLLLQPHIFAAAARHRDLVNEGALAETRQQLRGEIVLSELRRQKVVADIAITPEAMRHYYDQQTQRFYNRDQIDVAEVLLETEEEAIAVRREIEAGADIDRADHGLAGETPLAIATSRGHDACVALLEAATAAAATAATGVKGRT